jgi:hypothetical protein
MSWQSSRPHRCAVGAILCGAVLLTTLAPLVASAQSGASVSGEVRSGSTGALLPGAIVELSGSTGQITAIADARGVYRLTNVPAGRSVLRVRHLGHAGLELDIVVAAAQAMVVDLALAIEPVVLDPVTVAANRTGSPTDSAAAPERELAIVGTRALEASPGLAEVGMADAIRGIPGKEPADPGSVLYVRGAAADLKLVYLDGAPVYAPFPLGALLEPFSPGLLSRADIYLGGAPARYDGGLSYVMDLRTRSSAQSGLRAAVALDLLSARALVEAGSEDRFGVIATARGIHPIASAGFFNSALPYSYGEGLVRTDLRFGSSGNLSMTGFFNDESVRMGEDAARDSVVEWGNVAGSARVTGHLGRTAVEMTAALGEYTASLPFSGDSAMVVNGGARRTRFSADFVRDGEIQLRYGVSLDRQEYRAAAAPAKTGVTSVEIEGVGRVGGVYAELSGQAGRRVVLRGGARADYFTTTSDLAFAPRFAATWLITDRAAMTLAAGTYHQFLRPPDEILLSDPEVAQTLDSQLAVARATHVTASLDQDLGENLSLGIEGFYKDFSDVPGRLAMQANASGVDFWVRRSEGSWTGWLGYSLAWVWSGSEGGERREFSGRHLLSSGFDLSIRDRTTIDLRLAYGAGLPYSGIPLSPHQMKSAVGDVETDFVMATPSLTSAERGGTETAPLLYSPDRPFVRLDASISRRWSPRWGGHQLRIEPYLKVLNGLGRRDALFYFVNDPDTAPREIGALPILPVAGITVEF